MLCFTKYHAASEPFYSHTKSAVCLIVQVRFKAHIVNDFIHKTKSSNKSLMNIGFCYLDKGKDTNKLKTKIIALIFSCACVSSWALNSYATNVNSRCSIELFVRIRLLFPKAFVWQYTTHKLNKWVWNIYSFFPSIIIRDIRDINK